MLIIQRIVHLREYIDGKSDGSYFPPIWLVTCSFWPITASSAQVINPTGPPVAKTSAKPALDQWLENRALVLIVFCSTL